MKWPDHDDPPACDRLHAWINRQDTLHVKYYFDPAVVDRWIRQVAWRLTQAKRPLLWIESADVETTRRAVVVAQQVGATLHVAQSPGQQMVAATTSSSGWLGTSLAELRHAATLIVHVGHQHLLDTPLLLARFLPAQCEHLFLDQCPQAILTDELAAHSQSVVQLHWSRGQWLEGLTRALLAVHDQSAALARPADQLDMSAAHLAERLLATRYSVLLWSQDEFADEVDRLTIERLLELAQVVGRITRCTLLPLESDPGRVTAKDCVLWLTNRTGSVLFRNGAWQSADAAATRTLDHWRSEFDYRICIRSLPSDRPLPELNFDAVLDADTNRDPLLDAETHCYGPTLGLTASGQLWRGDHGLAACIPALEHPSDDLPSLPAILSRLASQLQSSNSSGPA